MVKILATADWQLDMKAHRLSKEGRDTLYKARLDALAALLKLAKKERKRIQISPQFHWLWMNHKAM